MTHCLCPLYSARCFVTKQHLTPQPCTFLILLNWIAMMITFLNALLLPSTDSLSSRIYINFLSLAIAYYLTPSTKNILLLIPLYCNITQQCSSSYSDSSPFSLNCLACSVCHYLYAVASWCSRWKNTELLCWQYFV